MTHEPTQTTTSSTTGGPECPGNHANLEQPRRKQLAVLVDALARGETHVAAAGLSGYGLRTVTRRLSKKEFREEVRKARDSLMADAAARVTGLMRSASDVLEKLLTSNDESIRLAAAKATFDFALRLRSNSEIEVRMQILEAKIHVTVQ
ncbi:MAG: hypothetical protein IAG10_25120 [Planctomycetaceae bacterium]|nr:hypothetical protein [Planctomycetaceae bacterium]